ncbi:hypothetical protein ELH65_14450 [Rhizobium ruizarguesonis]|nr:hypothetical protein ELH65_14450 [Rhizobium ruizarguesonis]
MPDEDQDNGHPEGAATPVPPGQRRRRRCPGGTGVAAPSGCPLSWSSSGIYLLLASVVAAL